MIKTGLENFFCVDCILKLVHKTLSLAVDLALSCFPVIVQSLADKICLCFVYAINDQHWSTDHFIAK